MTLILIIVGFMMLIALIIRFIQPELIYSARGSLIEISTNKAVLDYEAERSSSRRTFADQLIRDLRYETRSYDEEYLLQRVNKIRQLYQALEGLKAVSPHQVKENICIVELAEMLRSVGRRVQPKVEGAGTLVSADQILAFLANSARAADDLPNLENDKVQGWFMERPITIEQTVELLSAAVFALVYRQTAAARRESSPAQISDDYREAITKIERQLRWLVRRSLEDGYVSSVDVHKHIRETLGDGEYDAGIERMKKGRCDSTSIVDFVDFLHMKQLARLILGQWPLFEKVFRNESQLKEQLDYLLNLREDETGERRVPEDTSRRALEYCAELEMKIDDYLASLRTT